MLKNLKTKLAYVPIVIVPPPGPNGYGWPELFQLFKNLLGAGIFFAGLLVGISVIYGGFLVLTSAGDSGKVTQGRHAITAAVVGFAIVLSAWLIVNTLLTISGCEGAWYILSDTPFRCQ